MPKLWQQWWRLGGIAGIAFVVVFVVGVALQSAPPLVDDPIDEIRADWVNDGQRYLLADYLLGLAFALFYIPFIAAVGEMLGRAEGGGKLWSRVAFIGGLIIMLWGAWTSIFWGALAFGDFAETASDDTLQTLMALDYYAVAGMPLAFMVFIGATTLVIAQTGILRRWLIIVGALETVLAALAPLAIFSASSSSFFDFIYLIAFLILPLWILLVGILMVRTRDEPVLATP